MKKLHTYKIDELPADQTDLRRVKRLSERAINKAALLDEDAQPLSAAQLRQFSRVHPPEEVDVRAIRQRLHFSKSVFAACFGISKRTLQDWEHGKRQPKGPARALLTIIAHDPLAVQRALVGL